jgi:hypothetical protein
MPQGSFLLDHDLFEIVLQNNKRNKRQYDDGGFEEKPTRSDKKKKKDFSKAREQKRGELV